MMASPTPSADPPSDPPLRRPVRRLIGVYHASGTILGEIAYLVGTRLGRSHCALCDITHGAIREKTAWQTRRGALPLPFETVHLDERDAALISVTEGRTPCVVAETDAGLEILIGASELARCAGSPDCLVDAIHTRAEERRLSLNG